MMSSERFHRLRFLPAYGSIHAMKCVLVSLLATIALSAGLASDRGVSPSSPWEMAVETERWLVDGAGARFLPGMEDPARDGDSFVFVDETWPRAFQARIGDPVFLRVSSTTGCYDFEDADGSVFWTVVPYAPLTASGDTSLYHGNGGGVFVSTSAYDDVAGAGWGAAKIYGDGSLTRTAGHLEISENTAEGWGGGLYAGIVYPLYMLEDPQIPSMCYSTITLSNATVSNNVCRTRVFDSTCFPSQLVFERMAGPPSPVSLDSVVVDGNAFHDIGILFLESALPSLNGVTFLNLAENIEVKP